MKAELQEFYQDLFQRIHRDADADGQFAEDSFFSLVTADLIEAGEIETADRAQYLSARGIRVDGYGGDPATSDGVLTLIIADFVQDQELQTLTGSEMDAAFKRLHAFLTKSLQPGFRQGLEETSAGFGLADLIASSWAGVRKVRMLLISNRVLSSRVDGRAAGEYDGRPVTYSVWDISRLQRYVEGGGSREDLLVDLEEHGGPLSALPAHLSEAGYEAYLLVIPGLQLASIYDRWNARLLEQNVRVFLQARGGVNKGIRSTIENDPSMFFAYNNGITATAESVATKRTADGLVVTAIKNLQIVNGGQTTASIYAASRNRKAELERVFVQMKLSIIPHERSEEVVPRISEFANSQNKVNAADFFANHPFHLRMKEFSARLYAPSRDGTFRETKWFYERARGQYQDARSRLSVAETKKFDLEYPKTQVFTKTDLAKFLVVWDEHPDVVTKGAQKNFAFFAGQIGKAWNDNADVFNEAYFREAVAKAIVFQEAVKLVTSQPWYEGGGYRAQIVAYALSKIAHDTRNAGRSVDFERVWKDQAVSEAFATAITTAATAVRDVIVDPPAGRVKNVTEWTKQPACWTRVAALNVDWPKEWLNSLVSTSERLENAKGAIKEQRMLNGIETQSAVVRAGGAHWRAVREWGVARKLLSQREIEILEVASAIPSKIPSERQAIFVMNALRKLQDEGCPLTA